MIKILVFGTFDGLHEGHLDLFRQAKEYGDYLVVVVGRNSSVLKVKKRLPKYDENERLELVKNCELVDEAILGNENHDPKSDYYVIIKEINPDIICLGYDQANFAGKLKKELKEMNLNVKVKVLKPYKSEIYHSSIINK